MPEENGVHELSATENKSLTLLPLSRIKTIMKQCPDINAISQESLFIITRATELFIELMTREAYDVMEENNKEAGGRMNEVLYKDLASVVDKYDCLMFLSDIIPQKISVREYYKILQEDTESSTVAGRQSTPDSGVVDSPDKQTDILVMDTGPTIIVNNHSQQTDFSNVALIDTQTDKRTD